MTKILSILLLSALFVACGPSVESNENTDASTGNPDLTFPQAAPQPSATQPTANTDLAALQNLPPERKAHYTCPEFHAGSGSDNQGTCPTCGKEYVHNDVYHQLQANAGPSNTITVDPNQQQSLSPPPVQINQSGQGKGFHFICPDGHPGADAQGKCATCGKDLVHNDGYH